MPSSLAGDRQPATCSRTARERTDTLAPSRCGAARKCGCTASFKTADFAMAIEQAEGFDLPLWNGEWGVNLTVPGAIEISRRSSVQRVATGAG